MTGPEATKKGRGGRMAIGSKEVFSSRSSTDPSDDEVCFVTPPPAARKWKAKGNALARSPGCSLDFYPESSSSAPAKGQGKRGREEEEEDSDGESMGMSNEGRLRDIKEMSDAELQRDIKEMSDGELQREIAGLSTFARLLMREKRERRERFPPRRRRGIRTGAAKGRSCTRL